jgi:hypothetical protein
MTNTKTNITVEVGQFYMHKAAMDLCIEVIALIGGEFEDTQAVRAVFWNLGYSGKPWRVSTQDAVQYFKMYLPDWVHLDYDLLVTTRHVSGPPKAF